jgi:hypothetical protein
MILLASLVLNVILLLSRRKNLLDKGLFEKDMALLRRERIIKIEEEVAAQRKDLIKKLEELAIQCANQTKDYEHNFHQTRETLGIELAKLEAKKETFEAIWKNDTETYQEWLKIKDEEIERLTKIIDTLLNKEPNTTEIIVKKD